MSFWEHVAIDNRHIWKLCGRIDLNWLHISKFQNFSNRNLHLSKTVRLLLWCCTDPKWCEVTGVGFWYNKETCHGIGTGIYPTMPKLGRDLCQRLAYDSFKLHADLHKTFICSKIAGETIICQYRYGTCSVGKLGYRKGTVSSVFFDLQTWRP